MAGEGCGALDVMAANLSPVRGRVAGGPGASWQPGTVRLRWFLTMTSILAATVGLTVLVSTQLDARSDGGDQVVGGDPGGTVGPGATTTTADTPAGPGAVAPGQVRVTGTVTAVHLEGAVLEPREVPTPLTVLSERGFGNGASLFGVRVDGAEVSVEWDGGRPFVLADGGALVLDPVTVDLTPEGLRVALGDAVHALTPGTYRLDTPVAVGREGFATARDRLTFEATADTTLEPRGDAAVILGPTAPRRLVGPGTVRLEGALERTDAAGTRPVRSIDAAEGAFEITLAPAGGGGWTITAVLQGRTTST